jgi:ribonuclease III
MEPDRRGVLTSLATWLTEVLGTAPGNLDIYGPALTHPSFGADNYQRLEFLGDRVLGLAMAEWLSELFPNEKEGPLSHRFTVLVSGRTCAAVGRAIGLKPWLRLGKQARDDGGHESDNILGDVVEALLGAAYLDLGLDVARAFVRRNWAEYLGEKQDAPRHPKSLLHEWAEANRRKSPVYTVIERTGPDHAPRFTIKASVGTAGEATASGSSRQEAETAAAAALLKTLG